MIKNATYFQSIVDELLNLESGLSDWEVNFIEKIDNWLQQNKPLSESQKAVLTDLAENKLSGHMMN